MTFLGNPFSVTFKKKSVVLPSSTTQQSSSLNQQLANNSFSTTITPQQLNNELTANGIPIVKSSVAFVDNTPIPDDFFGANQLQIQNEDNSLLYSTVGTELDPTGTLEILFFQDNFTLNNQQFTGTKELIGNVHISDLYASPAFISTNATNGSVSLQDPNIAITDTFGCQISGSNSISLSQLTGDISLMQSMDKMNGFGKIYDFQFKQINFGTYQNANASICSLIASAAGYLSVDKLINDEYKKKNLIDKQHAACPSEYPAYNSFLVSTDYVSGGWVDFDALLHSINNDPNFYDPTQSFSVRTKLFQDTKRVLINLVLSYTSSIPELNSFGKLTDFGVRIKDRTTNQEFDITSTRNNNLGCVGGSIILEYYGKIQYVEGSTASVVTCQPCVKIAQDPCSGQIVKFQDCSVSSPTQGVSHEISPQFRINPLWDQLPSKPDLTNTIDPINWTTGIQNLQAPFNFQNLQDDFGSDNYISGHLNVSRGFALGAGKSDASDGFVYGGFFHSLLQEFYGTGAFTNDVAWNQIGNNYVGYQTASPGGYSYSNFNFTLPGGRELWNGTAWTMDANSIPEAKSMGLAGGTSEISCVAFGAQNSVYGQGGVVNQLVPSASTWLLRNSTWTNIATGNTSRLGPAGALVVSQSGNDPANSIGTQITCSAPTSYDALLNTTGGPAGLTPNGFVISENDANAISSFLSPVSNSAPQGPPSTVDIAGIGGICFGGYTAAIDFDRNPWSLDKIVAADLSSTFEWMSYTKTQYVAQIQPALGADPTQETYSMDLGAWMVDPTKNYPVATVGTLYLGDQCSGIATGGKSAISTLSGVSPNAHINIKYGYFDDTRYSEFNNSILNLAYEYNGTSWIRRDNLIENVAFHTGVGDETHSLLFGGLHASVELTDFSVAFPGCDDWVEMIKSFGGTWHRFGTTGLDREKRYASFATRYNDQNQNSYYKVGDKRDTALQGIDYSPFYLTLALTADLSGNNWKNYTDNTVGHVNVITRANDTQDESRLNITYFMEGESWIGEAIQFQSLDNNNPSLPYSEREPALDGTDQVGYSTLNVISQNTIKYLPTYRPDYNANPAFSSATSATSAFPDLGYFAKKNNYLNVVNQYQYAGHPATGGMWLWSRPSAGEELFHPENTHTDPTWFISNCGVPEISGDWQPYQNWLNNSFMNHTGIHSIVCWATRSDCADIYDANNICSNTTPNNSDCGIPSLTTSTSAPTTFSTRYYRWTVSDFRTRANRLSPGGKVFSCLDMSVLSDAFLLYNLGYITYQQLLTGNIPEMDQFLSGQVTGISGQIVGISGVCFTTGNIYSDTGLGVPFDTNPLTDFVGYSQKCLTPTDFYNRAWFVPMIPGIGTGPCSGGVITIGGITQNASGGYYDREFFAVFPQFTIQTTTLDITGYACSGADGFFPITSPSACNTCYTWFTSGAQDFTALHGGYGFLYKNNNHAPYLFKDESSYYDNSFPIASCGKPTITGVQSTFLDFNCVIQTYSEYDKQIDLAWQFELPNAALDNPYFDTLSFGLPAEYTKPSNMTYSFYISRDGVGLDQLFYGRSRNTFVERWKFPAVDAVIDALTYNNQNPYTINNDGTKNYVPLVESDLFSYGTLCVGEFTYPVVNTTNLDGGITYQNPLNSILVPFSSAQANFGAATTSSTYDISGFGTIAISGCNFNSLYSWLNSPIAARTTLEKEISHYYPMTYDNFTGPISGSQYFLPRGPVHQSQFSIIPSANSSSIRDRAALWPWCDLLNGDARNKPSLGSATWNWDNNGNIWVAECTNIEMTSPTACYDPNTNNDPLNRKITALNIQEDYLPSYSRETYVIRMFNKQSILQLEYVITYDESAGPEIIGSKSGFDYNIFGTSLIPRTIDLSNYSNKPLNGPTQYWIEDFDEGQSVQAFDWRRTVIAGLSGASADLYPYRHSTLCEMISGGYNTYNVENPYGYLCQIGGDADVWIYSAPIGDPTITEIDNNFYIAPSPFAMSAVMSGGPFGMQPVYAVPSFACSVSGVSGQNCGYGSEIIRSVSFLSGGSSPTTGACISTAYITGPESFGLGALRLGKSMGYGRKLLWNGKPTSCEYSSDPTAANDLPNDDLIRKSWPWNVLAFDGLIGPTGFTDALDSVGNYWMAIGDNLNTNPYLNPNVSFTTANFKNKYTIIKILNANKAEFFKTILAKTNINDITRNYLPITCLSQVVDATKPGYLNGARYREGIIEALNMIEGQRYYDIYVKIIQENNVNQSYSTSFNSKATFTGTTIISGGIPILGAPFTLPLPPLETPVNVKVVQRVDIASTFDINCINCYVCDTQFQLDSPTASPWFQHNHDEWVAPFMDSPFAGPYNKSGFNVWLTVGNSPRWGTPLWSDAREGKVWINYRRQKFHVNPYRNQLVLAMITSAVAIEDFSRITSDTIGVSGVSKEQVPVLVNYDEFLYCLDDYKNTDIVQSILSNQSNTTPNGVDCSDSIVASITDNFYTAPTSASQFYDFTQIPALCPTSTLQCISGALCANTWSINGSVDEAYVEWATSFIQELKTVAPNVCDVNAQKYYFKYSAIDTFDSNTFVNPPCIDVALSTPYDWRRYQDGVGLGGDAPAFNLYDDGREFTCSRLDQFFIGQTAFGSPDTAIIVGGFAVAGDGELMKSHCWWERTTFGTTFKWNPNIIQPEDTLNINYTKRSLSPFLTNGQNSQTTSSLGVVLMDVSGDSLVERQGSVDFVNVNTYKVIFDVPIPSSFVDPTAYSISLVASDNVKVYWADKSTSGFTINSEIMWSGSVDWSITMIQPLSSDTVDKNFNDETDVFSTKLDNL